MNRALVSFVFVAFVLPSAAADVARPADFAVSDALASQGGPALAYDPNHGHFLAVWTDLRHKDTSQYDIFGRIVRPDGRPATGDIAIATAPKGQSFPAAAFDPFTNRFLVVWTDWRNARTTDSDIYGQLIEFDGTLHGDSFAIAEGRISKKFPAVTFDSTARRFLVAWVDEREAGARKIYGRLVDPHGVLVSPEARLVPGDGQQDGPAVLYDTVRSRYLVVWRDTEPSGLFGTFVDAQQLRPGPRFAISIEKERVLPPTPAAVAFAPEAGLFLAVWTSRENEPKGDGMDVYGALLGGADGRRRSAPFPIAAAPQHQRYASAIYDPVNGRFLVVWYDLRRSLAATDIDIYGRFVFTDARLSDEFVISDPDAPGSRRYPVVSYSAESDRFLVLWEDGRSSEGRLRRIFGTLR